MLDIKRNLIRFLSHEIRTPLNAVSMGVTVIKRELEIHENGKTLDSEDILKVLEEIDSACNTSLDILNDLLTYEKIDAGVLILEKENVNAFSILHKSFLFLTQPIPFLTDHDFMFLVASIESPIWWILYALTLLKLIQFGITRISKEPVVLTIVFFLLGFILLSAITEVNFGTAYRHRSVIMMPMLFIYASITQLEKKPL
jgi:hypothetical protein